MTKRRSKTLKFSQLQNHPNFIKTVAHWWFSEWSHLSLSATTPNEVAAMLRKSLMDDTSIFPIIIVALIDNKLIGAAALNFQEIREYLPQSRYWLGNVYVSESSRNLGIGSALSQKIEAIAAKLNIQTLHLATEQIDGGLYSKLGWQPINQIQDRGSAILVMSKTVNRQPAIETSSLS